MERNKMNKKLYQIEQNKIIIRYKVNRIVNYKVVATDVILRQEEQ